MKKMRIIGIVLSILLGVVLFVPNTTYARRSKNTDIALITTIESYIESGDYEAGKNLIYKHFPDQFASYLSSLAREPLDSDQSNEVRQMLSNSPNTILENMSGYTGETSKTLTAKSRLIPLETKIASAKFGYLNILLFVCELRTGNLDVHKLSKTMPDFYHHLNWINSAYFMSDFNTIESEEIQEYKVKAQELLTKHLQGWLSEDLREEVFDVENLREIMSEEELREYCYYQTLATLILHVKGFDVPNFSDIVNVAENPEGVNIVSFSVLAPENLAVFREGSHYPEANFIVMPFFEWLAEPEDGDIRMCAGKGYLYTERGLFFVKFDKPLDIHYCNNYLFPMDGVMHHFLDQAIEHRTVPTPNFKEFGELTNDKSLSLTILEDADINVPRGDSYSKTQASRFLKTKITTFMFLNQIDEIVVKPFNTNCGIGISYFRRDQIDEAVKYIEEIAEKHGIVRYEERIYPPKISVEGELYDWNLRVFLSRNAEDSWVVSDIAVRYGNGVVNISKDAKTMTWDNLISYLGISESEATDLRGQIEEMSIRAANIANNKALDNIGRAEYIHEDFMSTDVICSQDLMPYIMELNNHTSGAMWNLDDAGGGMGRSSRDYVLTMIRRATEYRESLNDD